MNDVNEPLQSAKDLLKKASITEGKSTEDALKIASEALLLGEKFDFNDIKAESNMRIGRCFWISGDFTQATNHLSQALKLSTKFELHETKAESLIGLGNVYITMELIDQAINYYNTALNIIEEKGLNKQKSKIYNNLGTLHEDLKNFESALEYYQKSYGKAKNNDDEYGQAIAHLNMGNVHLKLDQLAKAYEHITTAFNHAYKHQENLFLAHCYYAFGQYYRKKKIYMRSIGQLKKGIKTAEKSKDFYILVRIYIELANAFDNVKKVKSAKEHFEQAFTLAKKMNSKEFMPKIHEELAQFYDRNLFKDEAYIHYKAYFDSSKIVLENRRKERIKNIEFQTKLKDSVQETKTYRLLSTELRKNYIQMKVLSDIGRGMTATNNINEIFNQVYDNVNKLMNADALLLGFHNEADKSLDFNLNIENNVRLDKFSLDLKNEHSLSVHSFLKQRSIKIDNIKKDYKHYIKNISTTRGELMHSSMYAPLIVEGNAIGVVSIQAKQKATYNDMHKVLFETLASYLAIAVNNALHSKELAKLNKKLKNLSERDGLTGVPNRRVFDELYASIWKNEKSPNDILSVLFIDIDNFKDYNDNYGHLVGDEVIIKVAKCLEQNVGDEQFLARYGGDEFVVLLPGLNKQEATEVAKQLKAKITNMNKNQNINASLTISMGIGTVCLNDVTEPLDFLEFVDAQLYESKKRGKNKLTAKDFQRD